jgi:hypothetical protein
MRPHQDFTFGRPRGKLFLAPAPSLHISPGGRGKCSSKELSPLLVHPSPAGSARGSRPLHSARYPTPEEANSPGEEPGAPWHGNATSGGVAPFGSHVSLAVTERDTVVFSSSAKGYA